MKRWEDLEEWIKKAKHLICWSGRRRGWGWNLSGLKTCEPTSSLSLRFSSHPHPLNWHRQPFHLLSSHPFIPIPILWEKDVTSQEWKSTLSIHILSGLCVQSKCSCDGKLSYDYDDSFSLSPSGFSSYRHLFERVYKKKTRRQRSSSKMVQPDRYVDICTLLTFFVLLRMLTTQSLMCVASNPFFDHSFPVWIALPLIFPILGRKKRHFFQISSSDIFKCVFSPIPFPFPGSSDMN